ncbi:hypothetical protein E4U21_002876 [Claviceps maximensis]|nr:hypothetical protein E4U21_002876 [Claviceps maximensis]
MILQLPNPAREHVLSAMDHHPAISHHMPAAVPHAPQSVSTTPQHLDPINPVTPSRPSPVVYLLLALTHFLTTLVRPKLIHSPSNVPPFQQTPISTCLIHAMHPSEPPMALQPTAPLPGADRIRSLQDDDDIFHAFDAYPWKKDKIFLSGLSAILGPPDSSSNGSPADMAIHARIFYYAKRIGVQVDFAAYKAWLAQNPHHAPPQVLPEEYLTSSSPSSTPPASTPPSFETITTTSELLLPWQQAAPKADLYIDRSAAAENAADGQPSYPMGFADMLKLLQEGKEIPGIRQIPNTIARDASVKPVGARAAPRKPWERNSTQQAPESSLPKALDTEFPSLDADADPVGPLSLTETATS